MKKIVLIGIMFILLVSCAHNKVHNYADYQRSFENGMTFYSQYEILYMASTKKGEKMVVAPFLADINDFLPEKVVKLHFGLSVINPKRETFTVWIDFKDDEFVENSRIVHRSQSLPDEFISVDLPFIAKKDTTIKCIVLVLGKGGNLLYQSPMARYKIKGSKKITL